MTMIYIITIEHEFTKKCLGHNLLLTLKNIPYTIKTAQYIESTRLYMDLQRCQTNIVYKHI